MNFLCVLMALTAFRRETSQVAWVCFAFSKLTSLPHQCVFYVLLVRLLVITQESVACGLLKKIHQGQQSQSAMLAIAAGSGIRTWITVSV
jgi:hypothetical protein